MLTNFGLLWKKEEKELELTKNAAKPRSLENPFFYISL